jgi:hypothetical protein
MKASVQDLLAAFDALPPAEQHQAAVEILRRSEGTGEMPEAAYVELADELFQACDAEQEAAAATPGRTDAVIPPGESPMDPYVKEIDPLAFALDRARTYLAWVDEHRASFETARRSDPEEAERELGNLAHSTEEARKYLERLTELLLVGYTIDPDKRLPRGLRRHP